MVEILENLAFSNLGDVIHGLACVVPHASIMVGEACQYWRYNNL